MVNDDRVQVERQEERQEGVVTRICSFKYGFIQTADLRNIFFHFSELSDEAKAVIEAGCRVQYNLTTNQWTTDKKMKAVDIQIVSSPEENAYKNMHGVVHRELGPRGFGFIHCENTTYFFPSNELVADEESNRRGNTARAGDEVMFDASWNHKYNPPKPYATNVRLVPLNGLGVPKTTRSSLNAVTLATTQSNTDIVNVVRNTSHERENRTPNTRSWRAERADATAARRSRSHARGSSLATLIPLEGGPVNTPAVGRTSGSRVSRVMGTCKPYSGDFASLQNSNLPNTSQEISVRVNNRALALKRCEAPVRMGSRQVSLANQPAETQSDPMVVAQVMSNVANSQSQPDNCESSALTSVKVGLVHDGPASMGEASLRVLVQALVQQGKTQYLVIRNSLQRPEYFGRPLTREEKQTISDILQDTMNEKDKENEPSQQKLARSNSRAAKGLRRQNSRSRQNNKSKSTGQLTRCNSNTERPPLAKAPSLRTSLADRLSLSEKPTTDRLSLTERLSTTDRLSLTMERLSLTKQYSNVSSISDFGDDAGMTITDTENQQDEYSLFADEPMRVSDCLAPVTCP